MVRKWSLELQLLQEAESVIDLYVKYRTGKTVFDHISKHQEESGKYNA